MKESRAEKTNRIKSALIRVGSRKELSEISMYDVAHEAQMSTSTVYHYYQNMSCLIMDYLDDIFEEFITTVRGCTNSYQIMHWKDVNRAIQNSLSYCCEKNCIIKKILYTHHQYHEVKAAIVTKDDDLGEEIEKVYRQHFLLPKLPEDYNIFVIALEASDSVYFSRNEAMQNERVNHESIIVSESYLSHYLPNHLPRATVPNPL